jgi:hypothetical protein
MKPRSQEAKEPRSQGAKKPRILRHTRLGPLSVVGFSLISQNMTRAIDYMGKCEGTWMGRRGAVEGQAGVSWGTTLQHAAPMQRQCWKRKSAGRGGAAELKVDRPPLRPRASGISISTGPSCYLLSGALARLASSSR